MNKKNKNILRWFISVTIITFLLSLFFSYISTESIKNIPIFPAIIILLIVIFIGIIFDIIAIAVTVANEKHFHAQASKKIKSANTAIKLIKNSHKVSNFCADVIGDISGVLSGAISTLVAIKISENYGLNFNMQFLISAIVASMTVGGKAIGKVVGKTNDTKIVNFISKMISKFTIKK